VLSSGKVDRLCNVPAVVQVLQKPFCDLKVVEWLLIQVREKNKVNKLR
jgi:hypothetical protein